MEIGNNLVELDIAAKSKKGDEFPQQRYLTVTPGEELSATLRLRNIANPMKKKGYIRTFNGQVYVEGFFGDEFTITSEPYNTTGMYEARGYVGVGYVHPTIPLSLREGTYVLAIELYAPPIQVYEKLHFVEPGMILARKRIPLVVGSPPNKMDITRIELGLESSIHIGDVENSAPLFVNLKKPFSYDVFIPELGYKERMKDHGGSNTFWTGLGFLPDGISEMDGTLGISIQEGNNVIACSFVPMNYVRHTPTYAHWRLGIPGKEFSEKLVSYRKQFCDGVPFDIVKDTIN